jgi:drug/metabolite transporter (DMT)-like permease
VNSQVFGIGAALISAAAWAAGAILYKKFGENVSSVGMNLAKGAINLFLLAVTVLLLGQEHVDLESFLLLGVSGLLGISLGDTFFFEALQKLGPHVLVVLSLLGQVLTVLFAIFFLGERLTTTMWVGILMVISGVAVVVYTRISDTTKKNSIGGIFYGLMAVLCMSVSVIIAKKGLASVSAVQATFIRMLWGTTGLLLWGLATGRLREWVAPFREIKLMKNFFLLVCLVSFGGFWLFHVAVKYTEVSIANTLSATEPLFVIPLAALFLNEKITWSALTGTVVSVGGIVLLCVG